MALEYRFDQRGNVELHPVNYRRSFCWLYFIMFVLALLGVVIWLYFSGYLTPADSKNSIQALSLRGKMDEQERLLAEQSEQIVRLESRVASAQRSEKIQATSNEALRDKLILAETELAESRRRLLLYEEILSPEALESGLRVQHLGIRQLLIDAQGRKLDHNHYYQYHLVLANVRGDNALVEGAFNLKLKGQRNGKTETLSLSELSVSQEQEATANRENRFSMKYYQSLDGDFELPPDFTPKRVIVELKPEAGKARKKVSRQYDWDTFELSEKSTTSKE